MSVLFYCSTSVCGEAFSSDSRIKAKIIDHGDGVFRRSSTSNASCLQHPRLSWESKLSIGSFQCIPYVATN
ncbi:hypothetical protein MKW98_024837 [Papaver atlanticum]|uniref:Uncharacterized protein n=1 Tax=Papaver atlanticum TaxID=357466 RepID=A0AAD4T4U1_9MAGN|nr:hypothetical protein MKW98_024837 [Papaver atlanticum]